MGVKPKPKKQRTTDKAQSERFKKTARELGIDEEGDETFMRAFDKIVPPKQNED